MTRSNNPTHSSRRFVSLLLGLAALLGATPAPGAAPGAAATLFASAIKVQVPAEKDMPAPPFIRNAPDNTRWTVTSIYKSDETKPAEAEKAPPVSAYRQAENSKRMRKSVVTKTGKLMREDILDEGGRHTERWFDGKTQYYKDPGDNLWFAASGDLKEDPQYCALPASGFRDLEWVNLNTFTGYATFAGRTCLVFTLSAIPRAKGNPAAEVTGEKTLPLPMGMIAYIDAETRLPLGHRKGDEFRKIDFIAPPQAALALPADLLQQIKAVQEANRNKR